MTNDRISLSPELLVAYADGELPPDQAAAAAEALRHDESAQETLRELRLGADLAGRAYADVIDEPVPGRLVDAARGRIGAGNRHPTARGNPMTRLFPLAAGIAALGIGLASGYLLRGAEGGYVPAAATSDALTASYEATLQAALDGGAPDQRFSYDSQGLGKGEISLGREFKTSSGLRCREFSRREIRGAVAKVENGIGCQGSDGSWNVMTLAGGS